MVDEKNPDPFFDAINYNEPVVFLRDVRLGVADRVKNDDVLTDSKLPSFEHQERKSCGCLKSCNKVCCRSERDANKPVSKCRRKCGCLCAMDDYVGGEYSRTGWVIKSGGFDIDDKYPGPIVPMPPLSEMDGEEQDFVKKLAVLAIKRYNKFTDSSGGGSTSKDLGGAAATAVVKCKNFVKANLVSVSGWTLYYVTFVATNGDTFQARVLDSSGTNNGPWERKVVYCQQKPSPPPLVPRLKRQR